jgi:hypothetical protein
MKQNTIFSLNRDDYSEPQKGKDDRESVPHPTLKAFWSSTILQSCTDVRVPAATTHEPNPQPDLGYIYTQKKGQKNTTQQ